MLLFRSATQSLKSSASSWDQRSTLRVSGSIYVSKRKQKRYLSQKVDRRVAGQRYREPVSSGSKRLWSEARKVLRAGDICYREGPFSTFGSQEYLSVLLQMVILTSCLLLVPLADNPFLSCTLASPLLTSQVKFWGRQRFFVISRSVYLFTTWRREVISSGEAVRCEMHCHAVANCSIEGSLPIR